MQGLRPTSRCKFIMHLGMILMHDLRPMRICHFDKKLIFYAFRQDLMQGLRPISCIE